MPRLAAKLLATTTLVALLLAGCKSGPAVGHVSGKVTFKGHALTEGKITFFDAKTGQAAEGDIDTDGSYSIKDVRVGEYVVTVRPLTVLKDTDPGKSPPAPEEKPAPNIPARYRADTTSPLKASVSEGRSEHNFDMTPK